MFDAVCFGEVLWDFFERPPTGSARGGNPVGCDYRRELGGTSANTATGLARLGVRVALVGGVGRDRFGDALVLHLARDGVDVRFAQRLAHRTGLTFVTRGVDGEPTFVPYRKDAADGAIRAGHLTAAMGRARWVVVGSGTLATDGLAEATARLLRLAAAAGAYVLFDLNVRPHLWSSRPAMRRAIAGLAARAAVVKASDADLRALSPRGSGYGWLERHAPQAVWLVTRGADRASAVGKHGEVALAARRGRCVDATGGGDAFVAGSLAALVAADAAPGSSAWADGALWTSVLRIGHMMGMKAVSRTGAVAGIERLHRIRAALDGVRHSYSGRTFA